MIVRSLLLITSWGRAKLNKRGIGASIRSSRGGWWTTSTTNKMMMIRSSKSWWWVMRRRGWLKVGITLLEVLLLLLLKLMMSTSNPWRLLLRVMRVTTTTVHSSKPWRRSRSSRNRGVWNRRVAESAVVRRQVLVVIPWVIEHVRPFEGKTVNSGQNFLHRINDRIQLAVDDADAFRALRSTLRVDLDAGVRFLLIKEWALSKILKNPYYRFLIPLEAGWFAGRPCRSARRRGWCAEGGESRWPPSCLLAAFPPLMPESCHFHFRQIHVDLLDLDLKSSSSSSSSFQLDQRMIRVVRLELLQGREGAKNGHKKWLNFKVLESRRAYRLNELQYLAHNLGDAIEAGDNRQHTKLWFFEYFEKRKSVVKC